MKDETRLVHAGRDPQRDGGIVNPPVSRASTVLYPTLDAFARRSNGDAKYRAVRYGAYGVANTFALADAVAELEGGIGTVVTSTGLSAVTLAIAALVGQGDHVLMTDSAYGPTRAFCDEVLTRFGVETTYYDPLIGADISLDLMRSNTQRRFHRVSRLPNLRGARRSGHCRRRPPDTARWSCWTTPGPRGFSSSRSITASMSPYRPPPSTSPGTLTRSSAPSPPATEALFRRIKDTTMAFGDIAAPDTSYLALRGLRSMAARLRQQDRRPVYRSPNGCAAGPR